MKFEFNKKYTQIALYACGVLLIIILMVFGFMNAAAVTSSLAKLVHIASPLIYGFVFAYLMDPIFVFAEGKAFRFVERKRRRPVLRRTLSLVATFVLVSLFLAVTVWMIIPQVAESYHELEGQLPGYIEGAKKLVMSLDESGSPLASVLRELLQYINVDELLNSISDIIDRAYNLIISFAPQAMSFMTSFVNEMKNILFGVVLSVYFLAGKEKLFAQIKKCACAVMKTERVTSICDFIGFADKTFGGFLTGRIMSSLLMGALSFVVFLIAGIPYAPLLAVLIGITDIIPFFGPFIGAVPSVFIVFISSPSKAFLLIILILLMQQVEGNIISPKILGEKTGLPSFWVMVSVTLMSGLLGVVGMFIGVPLFAVFYALVKRSAERRLERRGLPTKTEDYIKSEVTANEV